MYVNIVGNPDESTAVDYTVNAASGIANATGPVGSLFPVNNALPAWDIATGLNAVIGILAAERKRRTTGDGQLVKISLADVAFTMVANLGFLAQAEVPHENRPPLGNDMYGAFGRDFATSDGRRVMVVAISLNQWRTLVKATGIEEHLPPMERAFDADFTKEADRYRARDGIAALLKPWFEARTLDEVRKALDAHGVCWGPYQTFTQLLDDDWRVAPTSPVFGDVDHPGIGDAAHAGVADEVPDRAAGAARDRAAPRHAHRRGARRRARTCRPTEIGKLHDDGVVASAVPARCVSDATHARRRRVRRARARPGARSSRRRGSPPASTSTPRCSTTDCSRRCGTGRCFHPAVPDRRPRRRRSPPTARRDGRVPAAHVGRRPRAASTRPLRIGVDAERGVAHREGRREGGRRAAASGW